MALVSTRVSDLTGESGSETRFAKVTVRKHPNLDEPKVLDCLVEETELLKDIKNLVILEVQMPDGSTCVVHTTLADFNALGENMDGVLKNARGTRGREPGTRVKQSK
jgi:hypothetical protein